LTYSRSQDMVTYPQPKKSKADSLRADSVAKDSTAKDSVRIAAMPLIPDAARAAETPYIAMNDMRSYDLRKIDPRFDGRGSTVPKLRGVITPYSYDPDFAQPEMLVGGSAYASFDTRRVRRSKIVTATEGKFVVDDSVYSAPDGVYSFGFYKFGKKPRAVIW